MDDLYFSIALCIDDMNTLMSFCDSNKTANHVCSTKHFWKELFDHYHLPFSSHFQYNHVDDWLRLFQYGNDVDIMMHYLRQYPNKMLYVTKKEFGVGCKDMMLNKNNERKYILNPKPSHLMLLFEQLHDWHIDIHKNALLYPYPVLIRKVIDLIGHIYEIRIKHYNILIVIKTFELKSIKYEFTCQNNDQFVWVLYYLFLHHIVINYNTQ